ncbi:MerR family transcriptional regulator [Acaricomes phytoseiuli]|uniref:transcriptional regulator FtsR n=1 Tax=Acaricomes phytoseiuli TaxID=291968 RepID=UPI00037D978C|nr:MerR family transcriptional regulator [Acaricomes phytoseiuli]MCW1249523.1 MerR family transcriptional regulator [Acaricomes phytoseiuli]
MPVQRARRGYEVRQHGRSVVYNIGDVLAQLTEEFPAVTASKLRFYEEKGLVTPQRTAAGYRQFDDADIERLRFVLALQRDHFLPLKVIREYLEAIDRGEGPQQLPPGVSAAIAPRPVDASHTAERAARSRRLSAEQLRTESGASKELFESLMSYGLIADQGEDSFDEHALHVAKACVALAAHGIEARHLRPFQAAAEREFGLIERVVSPELSRRDGSSKARAAESAREIGELCLGLHAALVQGHIAALDH